MDVVPQGEGVAQYDDISFEIERNRTLQLFDQGYGAVAVTCAAAFGLWFAAGRGLFAADVWLVAMLSVLAFRLGLVRRFRALEEPADVSGWNRLYCAGTLGNGVLYAAWPVLVYPHVDEQSRLLGALVLGAMAGGSVAVLSVRRALALVYGGLLLVPASLMLLVMGEGDEKVAGVLGLFYFLTMISSVRATHQRITHALLYAARNARLLQASEAHEHALQVQNLALDAARAELEASNRDLERKIGERTAALQSLAIRDPLTGLPNRLAVSQAIAQRIAQGEQRFAVLFVDLDGFKEINDAMGHDTGDAVLREVASRLASHAGSSVEVARWGGDEFLLLLALGAESTDQAEGLAARLVSALSAPISTGGSTVRINACVGIALRESVETSLDRIVRQADMAVYAAKEAGPGSVVRYNDRLAQAVERAASIRQCLSEALAHDAAGLRLVVQPIYAAADRRLLGAECLARWRHPVLGDVPPSAFVEVAERTGLMTSLGRWVLGQACALAAACPESRLPYLAVNVSAAQILHDDLAEFVRATCERHALPPRRLLLELTESVFAQDSERVITCMQRLRALGVRLALDDFGTGYSSLAYLQRLPLQVLKIDRQFVADLGGSGARIVEASLSLAQAFGLETVAEGVESEAEARAMAALGVTALQGFHLARPTEIDAFLTQHGMREGATLGH